MRARLRPLPGTRRALGPGRPLAVAGLLLCAAGLAPAPASPSPAPVQESSPAREEGPGREADRDTLLSGAELDDLTARVANQLRCPVCRNQSVLESSSTLAREMQAEIRRRLARGASPEEVKAYFVSRYGEWILLRPPARGINLLVYLLPAVGLLLGAWIVWRLIRRWSSEPGTEEVAAAEPGAGENGAGGPGRAASGGAGLSAEEERRLREAMEREAGTS